MMTIPSNADDDADDEATEVQTINSTPHNYNNRNNTTSSGRVLLVYQLLVHATFIQENAKRNNVKM